MDLLDLYLTTIFLIITILMDAAFVYFFTFDAEDRDFDAEDEDGDEMGALMNFIIKVGVSIAVSVSQIKGYILYTIILIGAGWQSIGEFEYQSWGYLIGYSLGTALLLFFVGWVKEKYVD